MTQGIWDISLDLHVFFHLPVSQLPDALWPSSSGKKLSPYSHWSPHCVSLQGPLSFLCLSVPIHMSIHQVLWKQSLSYPFPCPFLGGTAQPSCEQQGVGAGVVTSQGTRWCWIVGKGWDREGHPGLEAQWGLTHIWSPSWSFVRMLYPRCSICVLFPTSVLGQVCLYSFSSSDNGFCPQVALIIFPCWLDWSCSGGVSGLVVKQGRWEYGGGRL